MGESQARLGGRQGGTGSNSVLHAGLAVECCQLCLPSRAGGRTCSVPVNCVGVGSGAAGQPTKVFFHLLPPMKDAHPCRIGSGTSPGLGVRGSETTRGFLPLPRVPEPQCLHL